MNWTDYEWLLAAITAFGVLVGLVSAKKYRTPQSRLPSTEIPKQVEPSTETKPLKPMAVPWNERLKNGLLKTRSQILHNLDHLFLSSSEKKNKEEILESLFASLIRADVGVTTSEQLINQMKEHAAPQDFQEKQNLLTLLKKEMLGLMQSPQEKSLHDFLARDSNDLNVALIVGVNGVGKTTTTGKLAFKAHQLGKKVVVGAADTFRAAAVEQLKEWANRSQAEFVAIEGSKDPASVAFEAVSKAKKAGAQYCFIDTAGRLHNRQDLMDELAKIKRVIAKECPGAPHHVFLVLDATTGQNAIQQAKQFHQIAQVTGIILTKLDGTAKGGVVLAIQNELKLPIYYIGVGEAVEDLDRFEPQSFVDSILSA